MPKKAPFSLAQYEKLQAVTKRRNKTFKTQKEHALALGITQQSLSNLIGGTYRPGISVAEHIAELEGVDLETLVGDFERPTPEPPAVGRKGSKVGELLYPNLNACVTYHSSNGKLWAAWVVAAAQSGYFGILDVSSAEWFERLNKLEADMQGVRPR